MVPTSLKDVSLVIPRIHLLMSLGFNFLTSLFYTESSLYISSTLSTFPRLVLLQFDIIFLVNSGRTFQVMKSTCYFP